MKTYKALKNRLLLFILFSSFYSISQVQLTTSENWTIIKEVKGIKFSTRLSNCSTIEGQKPLTFSFLKIENTTNQLVSLSFDFTLAFKEGCDGCIPNPECAVAISVRARETVEGVCSLDNNPLSRLVANPNLLGGWSFEKPLIKNLQIK
jgi:hypothetical protein